MCLALINSPELVHTCAHLLVRRNIGALNVCGTQFGKFTRLTRPHLLATERHKFELLGHGSLDDSQCVRLCGYLFPAALNVTCTGNKRSHLMNNQLHLSTFLQQLDMFKTFTYPFVPHYLYLNRPLTRRTLGNFLFQLLMYARRIE